MLSARYMLGVDGISLPLIILSVLLTPIAILAGSVSTKDDFSRYAGLMLILEGLMIGVFASTDALLFYFFWEAMLIPMFLVIGIWGGKRRIYATLKFFLFTFFGSVFMLIALIYLYLKSGSYEIASMIGLDLTLKEEIWIFCAFFIAFAVKIPMWPVHTWLPDAHVEAPTGGSVILAAVLLKMGGYGFLRFSLPITPYASELLSLSVIILSLIAITYISLIALVQSDIKKLIAYSSIAHMGFVTLGIFSTYHIFDEGLRQLALQGSMIQMISHGLISGALFFSIGVLYDRMHTRNIEDFGGVVNVMPKFAALFVLFSFANIGLPGTSGFIGEFFVILSSFAVNPWVAILAATTLVLGAAYTLWLVKRTIWGEVTNIAVSKLSPMDMRESTVLVLLALSILILGIWPNILFSITDSTLMNLQQYIVLE
jgi:NADH-quinone oxidoreductase subunit M